MRSIRVKMIILVALLSYTYMSLAQSATDSLACDGHSCCCGSSDPTPSGVMISHVHRKHEWMLSYRYMSMTMNGILSGVQEKSRDDVFIKYTMATDNMRMDMHMLMAMYGITDKLTVMGMLNYNVASMNMSMLQTSTMTMPGMSMGPMNMSSTMKTSGISDLKLQALYGLVNKKNHHLLVSTGLSIPTGNIHLKGKSDDMMYSNQRLPYAMQLGSGTYDVLSCVNYLFQQEKLTFSTQVSSVIRTGYNQVGYQLGNEATLNTWFAYQWLRVLSSSVRVEGNLAGRIKGYDPTVYYYNELSSNPYNYGGKRINCYVGSQLQFKKGFLKNNRFGLEYGIPLYQDLNGTQMKLTQTLYASYSIAF